MQGLNEANLCEFRCFVAKIEESEKADSCQGLNPGHLACVASALLLHELRQPDNYQCSQSSICTAQVVLNAPVTHLAATQYVPSELHQKKTKAQIGLEGSDIPSKLFD